MIDEYKKPVSETESGAGTLKALPFGKDTGRFERPFVSQ
jgi:hypothetical protein